MIRLKRVIATCLAMALLVAAIAGASAQSPVTATVDRTTLTTDDLVTLTIVVSSSGRSVSQPQLPDLAGFAVAGSSSSSQLSIVNGAISSSVAYSYRLQPYQTGTLTIGAVTALVDGQSYTTDPITVEVTQGNGTPTQAPTTGQPRQAPPSFTSQDLFVEAEVDKPNPYVGEQITYTFRFYEAADSLFMPSLFMDQPSYDPPALTGFWTEGEIQNDRYRTSLNGRLYTVTELRSILFPTAAGEVTIDPAQLTVPGFGFQRGGVLQSDPITVDVKPLPDGAPASFAGAVGQFALNAELDTQQTTLDEPVTARVTVSGWGNIGTAGDPVWPEIEGWRDFPGDAQVEIVTQNGRIGGTRLYEHTLIPTEAGELTVPGLAYSYFDPAVGEYRTLTTEPQPVAVAPGPDGATRSATVALADAPAADAATSEAAPSPLEPMVLPATLTLRQAPLTTQPWYWALWAMPAVALAGGFAWQQHQAYRCRHADRIRRSRAAKEAKRALARLPSNDERAAAARAGRILTDYLALKLGQAVAGHTGQALTAELVVHGVPGQLAAAVGTCLADSEAQRYAPQNSRVGSSWSGRVGRLIDDLDAVL